MVRVGRQTSLLLRSRWEGDIIVAPGGEGTSLLLRSSLVSPEMPAACSVSTSVAQPTRSDQSEMCSGSEAGSYVRLIDFCITQLYAGGGGSGPICAGASLFLARRSSVSHDSRPSASNTSPAAWGFGFWGLGFGQQGCEGSKPLSPTQQRCEGSKALTPKQQGCDLPRLPQLVARDVQPLQLAGPSEEKSEVVRPER